MNYLEKYNERKIRWSDRAIEQFSFLNNFILTLSIAFLSFIFSKDNFQNITFTIKKIDWELTITFYSYIFVSLSILYGFLIILVRLNDFRLTRMINQVRYNIYNKNKSLMDESSPIRFKTIKRFCIIFSQKPIIDFDSCNLYPSNKSSVDEKFRKLRNYSHNLGITTWIYLKLQIILFALSIFLHTINLF